MYKGLQIREEIEENSIKLFLRFDDCVEIEVSIYPDFYCIEEWEYFANIKLKNFFGENTPA